MHLRLPIELAAGYRSFVQRVRVISEAWAEANVYCVNCAANSLARSLPNTRAIDFKCPGCDASYQLKSRSAAFGSRIVDAAYSAMCAAVNSDRVPHLLGLHYDRTTWGVRDLFLVPGFAMSMSAIEKRKPLSSTARRKGWVGCYIVLGNIPFDARISLIENGIIATPTEVRRQYDRLKPMATLDQELRGWTLDVLSIIRKLGRPQFALADLYRHTEELQTLHPGNLHVQAKIRQQLQRLRDMGFIEFLGRGVYRQRN